MCIRQPVAAATVSTASTAVSSASSGRERTEIERRGSFRFQQSRRWVFPRGPAGSRLSGAMRSMALCSERMSVAGNSSIPLGHMNALKPMTPRRTIGSSWSRLPGTRPPHRPKSTTDERLVTSSFRSKASTSVVTGRLLRGMSTKHVLSLQRRAPPDPCAMSLPTRFDQAR